MGRKCYYCHYFFAFLDKRGLPGSSYDNEKVDHNPLDYFHMGIIEKTSFLSFDVEDPARHQKTMSRNDVNIEKQRAWIAKKKRLKST